MLAMRACVLVRAQLNRHSNVPWQAEVGESRGCCWPCTFIAATTDQMGQLVVLRELYVAEVTRQQRCLCLVAYTLVEYIYVVQDSVLLKQ